MKLFGILGIGALAVTLFTLPTNAGEGCGAKSTCSAATAAKGSGKDIVNTALAAGSFQTLATALKTAGLVETLKGEGPFTVFAPTDEAFAKLPKGTLDALLKPEGKATLSNVLTYHVVPGLVTAEQVVKLTSASAVNGQRLAIRVEDGSVSVAGVKVVRTDILCANGVIHVVDAVLMPATKNIVETAKSAGTFSTLLAAAQAAGLVETLSTGGPFTVFAPTDEAFAKLPKGTVESLLLPENKQKLADILKYHVVSGRVYADQVVKLESATTLQGQKAPITVSKSGVKVGDANVVKTDIETTNGVVHVIDSVLLPK